MGRLVGGKCGDIHKSTATLLDHRRCNKSGHFDHGRQNHVVALLPVLGRYFEKIAFRGMACLVDHRIDAAPTPSETWRSGFFKD